MSAAVFGFIALAVLSVGSAILMVANRNPVRSALFLVMNFFIQAVLYMTLAAQFIAAVQVIVYAGAIMVLFLFVIMLLNLGSPDLLRERGGLQRPVALILGLVFLTLLSAGGAVGVGLAASTTTRATLRTYGTAESVGRSLFDPAQPWLFPFEVTSYLLLVGVIGAVVLAKRKI